MTIYAHKIKEGDKFIHKFSQIEYTCVENHVDDCLFLVDVNASEIKGLHFFYDEVDDINLAATIFGIQFNTDLDDLYVITNGTIDSHVSFWKVGNCGYVTNFEEAARFTKEEAQKIIDDSHGKNYKMYPLTDISNLCKPTIHFHKLFDYENKLKEN